jgi:hypothetical protein
MKSTRAKSTLLRRLADEAGRFSYAVAAHVPPGAATGWITGPSKVVRGIHLFEVSRVVDDADGQSAVVPGVDDRDAGRVEMQPVQEGVAGIECLA